jgi:hypothetical protein
MVAGEGSAICRQARKENQTSVQVESVILKKWQLSSSIEWEDTRVLPMWFQHIMAALARNHGPRYSLRLKFRHSNSVRWALARVRDRGVNILQLNPRTSHHLSLMALNKGHEIALFGEFDGEQLWPLSAIAEGRFVRFHVV